MSSNDLTKKVKELKELKLMADDLNAEITAIEDELKAELTARNTTEIIADVFKIRWTPVSSTRLDSTAIKKELPEVYARYSKTTETRRFSIA
ncbi:MAG: hypothetical protein LBS21_13185 [Clostridiales bacterium]|jgi:predicted phage-related endonuclease|nr:hypothetical protein [Clostridiales bacterium]